MLHEVFGEKSNPGVVAVEDDLLPRCLGLPNEVVFQQRGRIQIHYHINESWDAASGDGLGTDGLLFVFGHCTLNNDQLSKSDAAHS